MIPPAVATKKTTSHPPKGFVRMIFHASIPKAPPRASTKVPESSIGDSQGTQDSPVILEDDEMNTPSIEAAAMLASADVGIESSLELKKPTSHVNQEAWYDIEYGCYVLEDCPLPLENIASNTVIIKLQRIVRRYVRQSQQPSEPVCCNNDGGKSCHHPRSWWFGS